MKVFVFLVTVVMVLATAPVTAAEKTATGKELFKILSEYIANGEVRGKLRNDEECVVTLRTRSMGKGMTLAINGVTDKDVESSVGFKESDVFNLTESTNEDTSFSTYQYTPDAHRKKRKTMARSAFFVSLAIHELGFRLTISETGKRFHALTCRVTGAARVP